MGQGYPGSDLNLWKPFSQRVLEDYKVHPYLELDQLLSELCSHTVVKQVYYA